MPQRPEGGNQKGVTALHFEVVVDEDSCYDRANLTRDKGLGHRK